NGRQVCRRVALRNDIAGWIPDRQSTQKLTVVFADHGRYLPAFRKARAHPAEAAKAVAATRGATTAATDEIGLFTAKYRISFADKRQSYASATGRLPTYFFLRRAFFCLPPLLAARPFSIA